jgi:hypothetical protein
MIQAFALVLLTIAATGLVISGARAFTAVRFSRALRAYVEPVYADPTYAHPMREMRAEVPRPDVPRQRAS